MQRDAVMTNDVPEPGAKRSGPGSVEAGRETRAPGFLRRHRIPLFLGLVALCLYAGSIVYIIYIRVPTT